MVGRDLGALLEPELDEVVVASQDEGQVELEVVGGAQHLGQALREVVVHEDGRLMHKARVAVRAVERHDLVAVVGQHLHARDHRGGGVELVGGEAGLERDVVDGAHVGEQVVLELQDNAGHVVEVAIEGRPRDVGDADHVAHADLVHVGVGHAGKDGVADAPLRASLFDFQLWHVLHSPFLVQQSNATDEVATSAAPWICSRRNPIMR